MSAAEERLRRVEKLLAELIGEVAQLRDDLDLGEPDDDRRARRMWKVLEEVDRRGARVRQPELLDIGQEFGYRRRGMAGFYQELFALDGDSVRITEAGRDRLDALRRKFGDVDTRSEGAS
jgi:hypothetical protein